MRSNKYINDSVNYTSDETEDIIGAVDETVVLPNIRREIPSLKVDANVEDRWLDEDINSPQVEQKTLENSRAEERAARYKAKEKYTKEKKKFSLFKRKPKKTSCDNQEEFDVKPKKKSKKKKVKKVKAPKEKVTRKEVAPKEKLSRKERKLAKKERKAAKTNEVAAVKKKKTKKPNIFKRLNKTIKDVSYKNLTKEIKGYGYDYSFKSYMIQIAIVLVGLVGVSYFYMLKPMYVIVIAVVAILSLPVIVMAQFEYLSNNDRFEQMINYMDQMILSFKQNPKILQSMESTIDLVDGKMRDCVIEAINMIKTDASSPNVYEKAFSLIEREFRCSRLRTLHKFLLNVELESSTSYQESIDNLYFDIRSWVTRTYQYQADLANVKRKIVIILGLSLGIAAFFTHVLHTAELQVVGKYEFNIIGNIAYQATTTAYVIAFIFIFTFLTSKITGQWLINDIDNSKEDLIISYINKVQGYDAKKERKHGIVASMFGILTMVVGFIMHKNLVIIMGLALALFLFMKSGLTFKKRRKAVERELTKEFPIWMRDIAINLNNMVVVRAVGQSYDTASPVLKPFILRFLERIQAEPNSIYPYMEFLGEFHVSEISSAVKTLYSIRMLSAKESQRQINDLIERNQTLLEASEKVRNQDSVAGVSFLSMLPMVLLSFKLMADLGLMMFAFMSIGTSAM